MKPFSAGSLMVLSLGIGWFLADAMLLARRGEAGETAIASRGIILERRTDAAWAQPHRLTMDWLIGLNVGMQRASLARLRTWKEAIGQWPPMANQLGSSLCSAHLHRLAPREEPVHRSPADQRRRAAALLDYWRNSSLDPPPDIPPEMLAWLRQGDLQAVLQAIDHRGERVLGDWTRNQFITLLAQHDSRRALDVASGLASKYERLEFQGLVVGVWAKQDAEASMRWLESLPQGRDRSQLGEHLLKALDPMDILEQADRLTSIGFQSGLDPRMRAYGRWAVQDPESARAWLAANPDPKAAAAMAQSLARVSPELAASMIDASDDFARQADPYTVNNVMEQYIRKDRAAALSWARGLEAGAARSTALLAAAKELAYEDPAATRALLGEVVENISDEDLGVLATGLASIEDRQPGLVELSGVLLRFEGHAVPGMADYVTSLARSNPSKAMTLFEELWAESKAAGKRTPRVGDLWSHWLAEDADAAAAWFAKQPESMVTESAGAFFHEWRQSDPEAALAWVESSLEPHSEAYKTLLRPMGEARLEQGRHAEALDR